MKFDPRELDVLSRAPSAAPPRSAEWSPPGARGVRLAEAIALACVAVYFAAAVVGIFLA
jgi:hypothetical protein